MHSLLVTERSEFAVAMLHVGTLHGICIVKSGRIIEFKLHCPAAEFFPSLIGLLFLKGFVTMTLESPEEIQDVSCAWKELNRKLSSTAVSQVTRMCLLKGNMVGFSR